MKTFVLGSTFALASLAGFAAQAQDTGLGTASVTVSEAPVTIGDSSDGLQFGTVVSGGSLQTYVVPPASGSSATFILSGQSGQTYDIDLPTAPVTLTSPSSDTLQVTAFSANLTSGTLGTSGQQAVQVGGTLTVPANTVGGSYSGTFTVTVNNP